MHGAVKQSALLLAIFLMVCEITAAQVSDAEVWRVAALHGAEERRALGKLLKKADSPDPFFRYETRLHSSLQVLLRDPDDSRVAEALLIFMAYSEDMRRILDLAPPADHSPTAENRWAYFVACALLEPTSEKEWQFLRSAAMNEYDDRWVDAGAIQTLRLIASPRSLQILEETRQRNQDRAEDIARAIKYIESNPPPFEDPNLEPLAKRVADALDVGKWIGNSPPIYNEARDKAQIASEFIADRDRYTYTATCHNVRGIWKLRGIWETMQAMLPAPPPRKQPNLTPLSASNYPAETTEFRAVPTTNPKSRLQ
jgi:hypothetical protein